MSHLLNEDDVIGEPTVSGLSGTALSRPPSVPTTGTPSTMTTL